jgi:hypothetical protein
MNYLLTSLFILTTIMAMALAMAMHEDDQVQVKGRKSNNAAAFSLSPSSDPGRFRFTRRLVLIENFIATNIEF